MYVYNVLYTVDRLLCENEHVVKAMQRCCHDLKQLHYGVNKTVTGKRHTRHGRQVGEQEDGH